MRASNAPAAQEVAQKVLNDNRVASGPPMQIDAAQSKAVRKTATQSHGATVIS
jgi:hypothetical protein